MSQDKPFVNATENRFGGLESLVGPQGGANSMSQVEGVSDMVPACQLGEGRVQKKRMFSASTSAWEEAAPQLLP